MAFFTLIIFSVPETFAQIVAVDVQATGTVVAGVPADIFAIDSFSISGVTSIFPLRPGRIHSGAMTGFSASSL